jgi:hypothetical protein
MLAEWHEEANAKGRVSSQKKAEQKSGSKAIRKTQI